VCPNRLCDPPSLLSNAYGRLLPREQSSRGVNLTTNLCLLPRLKMRGAIPPLPTYVFVVWCSVNPRDKFTFLISHPDTTCVTDVVFIRMTTQISLGYGLDDRGSRVRFPALVGNFCLHHRVQNGSGAHPASYPVGTEGSLPGGKAVRIWSWPLTSI
jgi:hypothetical protein